MTGLFLTAMIAATAAEPMIVGDELGLTKYAITQGGLLVVVLVLLYFWRRDTLRIAAKDAEKITLLTDLVRGNTAALTHSSDVQERLSRAVEGLETRIDNRRR